MTAIGLIGVALAVIGGSLSASAGALHRWQAGAALGVLVAALGLLRLASANDSAGVVVLGAVAEGAPAVTRVVIEPPNARRQVFAVPLEKPVSASPAVLGAMAGLGLLGLLLARKPGPAGRLAVALPLVAAVGGAWLFFDAAGAAAGEPAVRAFLSRALAGVEVRSFTVPPGGWTYEGSGPALVCAAAAAFALPVLLRGFLKDPLKIELLMPLGATLVTGWAGWTLLSAGGPWWSAAEGIAAACALVLGGAAFLRDRPGYCAALTGVAGGLAALGALQLG